MDREALIGRLRSLIDGLLVPRGLELVDLIVRHEGRDLVLRILVDRPEGGIALGECANINRDIGAMLDELALLEENYILEVSSPGLDRPLVTKKDFSRCLNKKADVFLRNPVEGKVEYVGVISKVDETSVYLVTNKGEVILPLTEISIAKQII